MKKNFSYTRRSFLVTLFNTAIFIVLIVRLFFLQIIKSDTFKTLSLRNSIKLIFLEPKRGRIYDSNDTILAMNSTNFKLLFYKIKGQDFLPIIHNIFKIFKFSPDERESIIKQIKSARYISPVILKESLDWNEVAKVESQSHKLPGTFVEKGYKRLYPDNDLFCHVVGYLGKPTKEEIQKYNLYHTPDFKVGKAGIEKTKQSILIGTFGMKRVEVNAQRKIVREFSEIPSITGGAVKVALNHKVQVYVSSLLGNQGATAVVLNIKTGHVLSMVSTPTFNPNSFATGMTVDEWNKIISNPSYTLTNKNIGKLYPPGSVWKIIVAIAILESGISKNEKVDCQGFVKIGNQEFKCWKHIGHGELNLTKALMTSCNPYFYIMSQKVGIEKIHEVAARFGLGKKTGIDLPGELAGINPNKEWKRKNLGMEWLIGDTANASIGQGFILATPLQMATMIARLAGGTSIIPSVMYNHNTIFNKLDINPEYLDIVKNGLDMASNHHQGIGYKNRIREEHYKMGAKTGTAQVISKDTAYTHQYGKQFKSHSIFTGFAPVHDPTFATAVVIDHGGWGSGAAAPIGRDILLFTQKTLY